MKIIIYLLFILVATGSSYARKSKIEKIQADLNLIDSVNLYFTYDKDCRISYSYDSRGNISQVTWQRLTDSIWSNSTRYSFTFDPDDIVLTSSNEDWVNNEWILKSRYTNINNKGKIISSLTEELKDGQLEYSSRTTYSYDSAGYLITYLYEIWTNSNWLNRWQNTYTYDKTGNNTSILCKNWLIDKWVNSSRTRWVYDSTGKMVSELYEEPKNDIFENYSLTSYFYNERGYNISQVYYRWKNDDWEPALKNLWTFDTNNNLTGQTSQDWKNGEWVNDFSYEYTYDQQGNRLSQAYRVWKDSLWEYNYLIEWTYNNNRKQTYESWKSWTDGRWHEYKRLNFKYNTEGLFVRGYSEKFTDGQWIYDKGLFRVLFYKGNNFIYSADSIEVFWKSFDDAPEQDITNELSTLNIMPQPADDYITVSFSLSVPAVISLSVINLSGVEIPGIMNKRFLEPGNYTQNVYLGDLPSGIYFIRFREGNNISMKKFIINK